MDHSHYCSSGSDSGGNHCPCNLSGAFLMHSAAEANAGNQARDTDSALYCNLLPPSWNTSLCAVQVVAFRRRIARFRHIKGQAAPVAGLA